jgi:hypothetical protein
MLVNGKMGSKMELECSLINMNKKNMLNGEMGKKKRIFLKQNTKKLFQGKNNFN